MRAAKLHVDASFDFSGVGRETPPAAIVAAFPLASLVGVVSLAGICLPATYARETANWAAQGIGQDWFDLVFAVPWLVVTAAFSLRRSTTARLLLAGGVAYSLYELVLYAFAVHFNAMFPVYCAALGIAFFSLVGIGASIVRESVRLRAPSERGREIAGVFLVLVAAIFSAAWLGEIIPALASGKVPKSIVDAGLPTNPVYVMDLSVVLPLHLMTGIALLQRRRFGSVIAPVVLSFDVIMAMSLAGMMLVMRIRGAETSAAVMVGMALISVASATVLLGILRNPRPT